MKLKRRSLHVYVKCLRCTSNHFKNLVGVLYYFVSSSFSFTKEKDISYSTFHWDPYTVLCARFFNLGICFTSVTEYFNNASSISLQPGISCFFNQKIYIYILFLLEKTTKCSNTNAASKMFAAFQFARMRFKALLFQRKTEDIMFLFGLKYLLRSVAPNPAAPALWGEQQHAHA